MANKVEVEVDFIAFFRNDFTAGANEQTHGSTDVLLVVLKVLFIVENLEL